MAEAVKCEDKAQYRWGPDTSADGEFTFVSRSVFVSTANPVTWPQKIAPTTSSNRDRMGI